MKFLLQLILLVGSALILQLFLPFWVIAVAAFVITAAIGFNKPFPPFFAGLLGGILLWGGMAYFQNMPNDGLLGERIAELMGLGGTWSLIGLTALLGGLLAGLGSLSGFYFRGLFQKEKSLSA